MGLRLRRARTAFALALAGAVTGGIITRAAMPYIKQIDPLGILPVVLISVLGGFALGWFLRGRTEPDTTSDPTA
jgi:hypothetical protein